MTPVRPMMLAASTARRNASRSSFSPKRRPCGRRAGKRNPRWIEGTQGSSGASRSERRGSVRNRVARRPARCSPERRLRNPHAHALSARSTEPRIDDSPQECAGSRRHGMCCGWCRRTNKEDSHATFQSASSLPAPGLRCSAADRGQRLRRRQRARHRAEPGRSAGNRTGPRPRGQSATPAESLSVRPGLQRRMPSRIQGLHLRHHAARRQDLRTELCC